MFAAMLLGMAAKYLWEAIERRRDKIKNSKQEGSRISLDFDFWDFVQPVLVSAIVFSAVLTANRQISFDAVLFSFQNGFFWQSVFTRK